MASRRVLMSSPAYVYINIVITVSSSLLYYTAETVSNSIVVCLSKHNLCHLYLSHHFAWLLLNHSIQSQLLHAHLIQNTNRYSRQEPKNAQERACTHKTDACVCVPRTPNQSFSSCCLLWFLPPHSVHCIPYWDSNFCVKKKFRTEPNREKARVSPNARASSFPRNQNAVIRFWTTEKWRETHEIQWCFFHGCLWLWKPLFTQRVKNLRKRKCIYVLFDTLGTL